MFIHLELTDINVKGTQLFCLSIFHQNTTIKVTKPATMNFFRKIFFSLSFLIIELSYVFTINMLATAEKCMEK